MFLCKVLAKRIIRENKPFRLRKYRRSMYFVMLKLHAAEGTFDFVKSIILYIMFIPPCLLYKDKEKDKLKNCAKNFYMQPRAPRDVRLSS